MTLENPAQENPAFENRVFADRRSAGEALAERLAPLAGASTVILGLPRGGVPVAAEVARRLHAPLDVLIVRKVGVPTYRELAMGAAGEEGVSVRNDDVIRQAGISDATFERVEGDERVEIERRALRYRRGRPMIPLAGADVIIVDDGIATGSTASAAVEVARRHGAGRVFVATPVTSREARTMLADKADEVIALQAPRNFVAVGKWYRDFNATSDEEVERILAEFQADQTFNAIGQATPAAGQATPTSGVPSATRHSAQT